MIQPESLDKDFRVQIYDQSESLDKEFRVFIYDPIGVT
jgi:hypothetical protein